MPKLETVKTAKREATKDVSDAVSVPADTLKELSLSELQLLRGFARKHPKARKSIRIAARERRS